jgi:phage shock protein PspC (stress-responsive transcriptional regulator)
VKRDGGWLGFAVVVGVAAGIAAGLSVMLSQDPLLIRAVEVSAVVALVVQLAGFGCAKYLIGRKMNLFAAWGGAMGVRLLSLVIYALLVIKSPKLGLQVVQAPALVTFALLLFVTSIVEPIFLNTQTA